jgi:mannose-6-phosphate isomerase-like protein (cupin superfamily)
VSPPSAELRGEMVEVHIPPGATVSFDTAPIVGLEHHLWMLEGAMTIDVERSSFSLATGDCLRYVLTGASRFRNPGKRTARYVIAMVRP